jgi:hypothetical protein
MKYKISFQGWDAEFLISEVPEKMYRHFKDNGLDVTLHMCGTMEDELPDDICDGINYDTKFECDRLYHNCGPQFDGSCSIHVNNSDTDQEVYCCDLDEWEGDSECEQDVLLKNFGPRHIMVGGIYSKGYAAEYNLELKDDEQFDSKKLTLLYDDIDEDIQIITGVRYNNFDLACTGELSTMSKDERWFIEDTETSERTVM